VAIIIASSNLFRLELSAYLLSEAGYAVIEAESPEALLRAVDDAPPSLIVFDSQLDGGDPSLLHTLLQRAVAPVLVLGEVHAADLPALQAGGGDSIGWPYQNDDLVARAAVLRQAQEVLQNVLGAG
jgi:DNA-binding response OmpR family regulator